MKPKACRGCGIRLTGEDSQPLRHLVWEIPEIKPLVTEYQRHRLNCPGCGKPICCELPAGVPSRHAGPRLVALFLEQVLNQPCSPGWGGKLQDQATAALTPVYDELAAQLPNQPILGMDESPTKQARLKS